MDWVSNLYNFFANLALTFHKLANQVSGWGWPLNKLASPLNTIAGYLNGITDALTRFALWVWGLDDRIKNFILKSELWVYLSSFLNQLGQVWAWFVDRWRQTYSIVEQWWTTKYTQVLAWINQATQGLSALIDDLKKGYASLKAAWDAFKVDLLSKIPSWTELLSFINTQLNTIKEWFNVQRQAISGEIETNVKPLRDEVNKHTSWLDMIKKLFTNPEEFILELLSQIW